MKFSLFPRALQEALDRSFAWKVRWRIERDRNPRLVEIQDKYLLKAYARRNGVNTAGVLHVTQQPKDIPFADLPENCFIKATHGCGWNIARLDGRLYRFGNGDSFYRADGTRRSARECREHELTEDQAVALCRTWLDERYRLREWAYQAMQPRIMVEQAVAVSPGSRGTEYKLYTMDGRVKAVSVVGALFRNTGSDRLFFDRNWQQFEMSRQLINFDNEEVWRRPASLDEMIASAERLAQALDFVRVDMYDTADGPFLGEMTVYPYGGIHGTPASCRVFNKWLGDQWTLPVSEGK